MIRIMLQSLYICLISQILIIGINDFLPKKHKYIFFNFLCVLLTFILLNIFIPLNSIVFTINLIVYYVLSLSMYYVNEFRGTNLNFSDIKCIKTAKEVAGGYKYRIKLRFIVILFINILLIWSSIKEPFNIFFNNIKSSFDLFEYLVLSSMYVVLFVVKLIICFLCFIYLKWKISTSYFNYSLTAGSDEGYIYNFFSSIPIFHRVKEYDYDAYDYKHIDFCNDVIIKKIDEQIKDLPHIIVIMNESFGSVHNRVNTNISITPVFDNLNGVKKGELFVNTFGGGTANTEFEFLTGITVGNLPYPNIPYNNINQNKYSVARYLKKLNYKTIAMHPYIKTNYNRDKIYNFFGFDDYITINDFKYTEKIHNFISDESMYNEIIDRFEMLKNNYNKTFIFGITIQNHSINENYNKHDIVIDNDYKNFTSLKSYLSLLHKYDQPINIL